MRHFSVERIDPDTAHSAWSASNEALVFTQPRFLAGLCHKVDWWMGVFRSNPVYYWPVCLDHSGKVIVPALPKYVGPFATDDFRTKAFYRQWSIQGDLFPAFMSAFAEEYEQIAFTTQPGQTDIRQFEWWAEQNDQSLSLDIQPKYTAVVNDLTQLSDADLLARFRRDRKAQLSRAQGLDLTADNNATEQEVCDLYQSFMEFKGRQELAVKRSDQVRHIVCHARDGDGEVVAFRDRTNALVGVLVLLYSRVFAHSAMAIASEKCRNEGIIALLEFAAIRLARAAGKNAFDFLGANSAVGASEKHSYGATPQLYFRVASRK
jgi:hypothetical protein